MDAVRQCGQRAAKVLNILSQQESTVEDDEKFRDVQQAYVLLGFLAELQVELSR